jgi:hypothetical protein
VKGGTRTTSRHERDPEATEKVLEVITQVAYTTLANIVANVAATPGRHGLRGPRPGPGADLSSRYGLRTQRKPMWLMPVSIIWGRRAAGR